MTESKKCLIKMIGTITFVVMLLLVALEAEAGGNNNDYIECYQCSTNHITEVTEVSNWRLTESLSESDLNSIIGSTLAGGSHQFDWVTTRVQLSITFSTTTTDWDEDTNFSFAIGKRFGKDSKIPNALWHLGYTPDIYDDNDYIHGGATILMGGSD